VGEKKLIMESHLKESSIGPRRGLGQSKTTALFFKNTSGRRRQELRTSLRGSSGGRLMGKRDVEERTSPRMVVERRPEGIGSSIETQGDCPRKEQGRRKKISQAGFLPGVRAGKCHLGRKRE